ncbi:MAG TPA: PKD domain-containing protein, partial [Gemmatimonadaceae bacterium]|nr:PKD domain-containing protein [Gemmatimonadaceae bacterium]
MASLSLLSRRVPGGRILGIASLLLLTVCENPVAPPSESMSPGTARRSDLAGPAVVLVGAGNIASCANDNDLLTSQILDTIPGTVVTFGDNDRRNSATGVLDFGTCYTPSWGGHKARTRPAAGDREYLAPGPADYYAYFGAAAGEPDKGYYSYEAGDWHVVVLNTELPHIAGSAQEQWLRADLSANTKRCTLAYWDAPRYFTQGTSGFKPSLDAVWTDLYNAGVELVLNGHSGFYERFAPQRPNAEADPTYGIRQIIVGTGGGPTNSFSSTISWPNSEVRSTGTAGVIKLTLSADGYAWQFIPVAGKTFTDAGTGSCHDSPMTQANPGGPYFSEGTVAFDGSHSFDPQREYPLTYAWDFGDGTTGTGVQPAHAYAEGTYTVTLVATDAAGNSSQPASTTATIGNLAPTVSATSSAWARAGQSLTLSASLSDPGTDDAPWSYRIDWGDGSVAETGSLSSLDDALSASHAYASIGDYTATIAVTDKDGATGTATIAVAISNTATPAVILAAGDISACFNNNDEATAKVLDGLAGTVFTLGDNAYPNGAAGDFSNCYEPTWGRHKGRTYATLGNHDYDLGNANAIFDYFGARAGPRGKGYY